MSKKTLYICGDSFCSVDPEYGKNWPDLIAEQCPNINVVNLSSLGASNYLVHLQVRQALANRCDYLIYHATSSIRQEFLIKKYQGIDSADRYWSPQHKDNKSIISNTWIDPQRNSGLFTDEQLLILKQFFTNFVDMPSTIMKNYIFITHTLDIINEGMPTNWVWSRGGFEHYKFKNTTSWDFSKYTANEAEINLWDDYNTEILRPYFHITDKNLLQKTCDYYIHMLNLNNV